MGVSVKPKIGVLLLVLALLLLLTASLASSTTVEITGVDNIPQIRGLNDITDIKVTSSGPVSIIRNQQEYEMQCELDVAGTYSCTHTFPQSNIDMGEYVLKFKQTEPSAQTFTWPFVVDGKAPYLTDFTIKEDNGKLNISITAKDEAFPDSETCAGLANIEISTDSDTIYSEDITEKGICDYTKTISITPPSISGEVTFLATLTDKVGLFNTTEYGSLDLDFSGPNIKDDVLVVHGDKELGTISPNPITAPIADVVIRVEDENLEQVQGDLHLISRDPALKDSDSNRVAKCDEAEGYQKCVFENVLINPGKTQVPITITATDLKGQVTKKNLTVNFKVQTKSSEIIYFGRNEENCFERMCYLKSGINDVHLHITTQDVELKPYLISISGSGLSTTKSVKAARCNDTGEYYDCYAYLPVNDDIPSGSEVTIGLADPSTDALGSRFSGITSTKVKIDHDVPVLGSLNFSNKCPIAGETATFTINVTDVTSPILKIEASPELITQKNHFEQDCQKEGSKFVCNLDLNGFVSYAEEEPITVTVKDLAGNKNSSTYDVKVCEAEREIAPEFISSITTDSKQKIDKRIFSVMTIKAYLPLKFNKKNNAMEIVDLDTDGCIGTINKAGEPYFLNKLSDEPILVVPLTGKDELQPKNIPINCTIKIYEKRGTVRYVKPELQDFHVELPTFNQELGTVSTATQDKLDQLSSEIGDIDIQLVKWYKYLKVLDGYCKISGTFGKVMGIISGVKTVIYGVAVVLKAIPFTTEAADPMWNAVKPIFDKIEDFRNKLWPTGKFNSGGSGGSTSDTASANKARLAVKNILKMGCLTYNCGLCSPEGALQAVNIVSSWSQQAKSIDFQTAKELEIDAKKLKEAQVETTIKQKTAVDEAQQKVNELKDNGASSEDIHKALVNVKNLKNSFESKSGLNYDSIKTFTGSNLKAQLLNKATGTALSLFDNYDPKKWSENKQEDYTFWLKGQSIDDIETSISAYQDEVKSLKQDSASLEEPDPGTPYNQNPNFGNQYERFIDKQKEIQNNIEEINKNIAKEEKTLADANIAKANSVGTPDEIKSEFEDRTRSIESTGVVKRIDPYEFKNFAIGCACAPGYVYAREKLRQLKCREYKCIEENVKVGLPITSCEIDFAQGKCMYYDNPISAQARWKIFGRIAMSYFWGDLTEDGKGTKGKGWRIANKAMITTRKVLCMDEYLSFGAAKQVTKALGKATDTNGVATGWRDVYCGATGAILTVEDFISYFKTPFVNSAIREVPGEDYCKGVPTTDKNGDLVT